MASTHDETTKTMTEARTDPAKALPADGPPKPAEARPPSHRWRKWLVWMGLAAGLAVGGYYLKPAVETALNTVSTDDAYVNGHVTLVAPRVSGQVSRVLVDDNDRVKKGALLVQLDKEPFEDQVELKKAAVTAAESDLVAAEAQTRGLIAQIQADRFQLERAIEDVHTQVANLRAYIATLKSRRATLELRGTTSGGARSSCRVEASARRSSTSGARRSRSMSRLSIKPWRPSWRRESVWASPPSLPRATTWARSPTTSTRITRRFGRRWDNFIAASPCSGTLPGRGC